MDGQEKDKDNGPSKFHNLIKSSLFLSQNILAQNMVAFYNCLQNLDFLYIDFYIS